MLRQLDLSDLIESSREDVLSASVDIDPTKPEHQHDPPAYLIWLRHAPKETVEGLPRNPRLESAEIAQRMVEFLEHERPADRGVALYAARDLWQVYVLPVPLPKRVRYGPPDVEPVLRAIDEYEPYAILVVDRGHARIVLAYPLTVSEARALGLSVTTAMPEEVYRLMSLYPQAGPRRPSVECIPMPYHGWQPRPAPSRAVPRKAGQA